MVIILHILLAMSLVAILFLWNQMRKKEKVIDRLRHGREELINKWYMQGLMEGGKKAYDDIREELVRIAKTVGDDEKRHDV